MSARNGWLVPTVANRNNVVSHWTRAPFCVGGFGGSLSEVWFEFAHASTIGSRGAYRVMPSHRVEYEITCPSCGASGVVRVVEDAAPPFDDLPRRTYLAEADEFLVTPGVVPMVECLGCSAMFQGDL